MQMWLRTRDAPARMSRWNALCASPSYGRSSSAAPLGTSGRSPMTSRTVTARSGADLRCGTAQKSTPPGRLNVSCGELKHVTGSGQSGIVSPGAAASRNARLRDWPTP